MLESMTVGNITIYTEAFTGGVVLAVMLSAVRCLEALRPGVIEMSGCFSCVQAVWFASQKPFLMGGFA